MPPSERPIPMFAAEPPQEPLPYGRWAEALRERFEAAADEQPAGELTWFPDRSFGGRTYVPVTAPTGEGEVCGYVSYRREHEGAQATDFQADSFSTDDTADLCPTTTDQCELIEDRFTLVTLDDFTGDYVEVRLYGPRGMELAAEPLYEED